MIKLVESKDKIRFYKLGSCIKSNFADLFNLEELLSNNYNYIFGYYEDDKLIGFLHLSKSYEVIDVVNIVVDSLYLRKGIASKLLNYAFNNFDDVTKYLLEVKVTNKEAISLYQKMGFKIINIRKKYYDGADAYIMERSR